MKPNGTAITSLCLALMPSHAHSGDKSPETVKPNILFICVDDLRRDPGCYGSEAISPNIDNLARQGTLFFNHYAHVPTSGASRNCLLTGMLPRNAADLSNDACRTRLSGKPEAGHPETMFHHLRRNGYHTIGIGKISHHPDGMLYGYTEPVGPNRELPHSWDEMLFDAGKWGTGWNAFFGYADGSDRQGRNMNVEPYEVADVADEDYPDGLTAGLAVEKLKSLAVSDQPFCLAVGFFKPHLPFNAPKKYWNLYRQEELSLPPVPAIPEGCSPITLHDSAEFNSYRSGAEKASLEQALSDGYTRTLRHAYYACISYVDAQIGKILDTLDALGLADNTIVVLWGDHGWHLGDHRVWGKHTLHETSLCSALVVKAPGRGKGIENHRIVGSVDIYPTLMELCGVAVPDGLDGESFAALLDSPGDDGWKDVAYGYYRSGISVRTPSHRLSRYFTGGGVVTELYEYETGMFERRNIAAEHPETVEALLPIWVEGNTLRYGLNGDGK